MSRKDYLLSEREGLTVAMKQLKHFNVWAICSLDESQYEEDLLIKYFDADFESPINAEVEKIISTATVATIYEKNYIPNKWKRSIALKAAREQVEVLRVGKITYHKEVKGMPEREAQARSRENKMLQRAATIDTAVKFGCRKAAKTGISYGIGALVSTIVGAPVAIPAIAAYAVIPLVPKKVRDKVVDGASKVVDTVVKKARNTADQLASKGVEVAQKAKTTIEEVASNIKEQVSHAWMVAKEKTSQFGEKIKGIIDVTAQSTR